MIGLLLDWLERRANSYLLWCHERRVEVAAICPDCEFPETDCYCAEKRRIDAMCEGAFDIGYERAQEEAW